MVGSRRPASTRRLARHAMSNPPTTKTKTKTKTKLTGLSACTALATLAAILLLGLLSPGSARPQTAAGVEALPSTSSIAEGPGGRTALRSWTLRRDPADRGTALGWQRGGVAGARVGRPQRRGALPLQRPGGARQLRRLARVVSHDAAGAGRGRLRADVRVGQLHRRS